MHSNIRKLLSATAVAAIVASGAGIATMTAPVAQEQTKMVGGAEMFPSRNIVENAVNSNDHTTLVAAVQAADLVDTLSGAGPFTVFAPVNAAFEKLPAGTVETLLEPANKDQLTAVLTYHVVPGNLSGAELLEQVNAMGGEYELTTVQGETLTVVPQGQGLAVMDATGQTATITIADVNQSNGVIHVVNTVLLPG